MGRVGSSEGGGARPCGCGFDRRLCARPAGGRREDGLDRAQVAVGRAGGRLARRAPDVVSDARHNGRIACGRDAGRAGERGGRRAIRRQQLVTELRVLRVELRLERPVLDGADARRRVGSESLEHGRRREHAPALRRHKGGEVGPARRDDPRESEPGPFGLTRHGREGGLVCGVAHV